MHTADPLKTHFATRVSVYTWRRRKKSTQAGFQEKNLGVFDAGVLAFTHYTRRTDEEEGGRSQRTHSSWLTPSGCTGTASDSNRIHPPAASLSFAHIHQAFQPKRSLKPLCTMNAIPAHHRDFAYNARCPSHQNSPTTGTSCNSPRLFM
eukprot:scaffold124807_cov14-Tisochrysis_lutea.AAC.1